MMVPGEEGCVRTGAGRRGFVLWFTGLSGSGKSTLAQGVGQRLSERGWSVKSLDGDIMRQGLNSDLGFSDADRRENVRRLSEVAALFADSGFVVLTAAISPFRDGRQRARERIGADRFVEIWARADLAACEARDPKGLYQKARAGQLDGMTGISSPYEPPLACEIAIDTYVEAADTCVARILDWLTDAGYLQEGQEDAGETGESSEGKARA